MLSKDAIEQVLRIHCDGDVWLWQEKGAAFLVRKQNQQIELVLQTDQWTADDHHHLRKSLSALGFSLERHPEPFRMSSGDLHEKLIQIREEAKGKAVVDYGAELLKIKQIHLASNLAS